MITIILTAGCGDVVDNESARLREWSQGTKLSDAGDAHQPFSLLCCSRRIQESPNMLT